MVLQFNWVLQNAFWIIAGLVFVPILALDWFDWSDPCLAIYASVVVLSMTCGCLFADWWRVKGSATSIYKWITMLLFALAYNDGLQWILRYLYLHDPTAYHSFVTSLWWEYRAIPKLAVLVYLMSFAIWQRFGRGSTYHSGIRADMANGFERLEGRIVAGELRFEGHSHDGLVIGAKLIVLTEEGKK
jgi:hypothetical protein